MSGLDIHVDMLIIDINVLLYLWVFHTVSYRTMTSLLYDKVLNIWHTKLQVLT